MNIYIDSCSNNFARTLENTINTFPNHTIKPGNLLVEVKTRGTFLDDLKENRRDSIGLMIYHISKSDFHEASLNGFQFDRELEDDNHHQHPLYYRFSFSDYKKLDICSDEKDNYKYQSFCFPILYITDFKLFDNEKPDYSFLDSSIWHRGICIDDPLFVLKLYQRLNDFQAWHEEKLYKRLVAIEALDYHIRMFQEQRLPVINPNDKIGHASFVNLGFWHSETEFEYQFNKQKNNAICPPRRFLLVDDYANMELRELDLRDSDSLPLEDYTSAIAVEEPCSNSKTFYIWKALKDIYKENRNFELDFVTDIKKAKSLLAGNNNGRHYDIILLDYLLKSDIGSSFIKAIADDDEGEFTEHSGLFKKYWIFPVSAFSSAMSVEMSSGKLKPIEKSYILHPGADPVNTPQLFRDSLYKFLEGQYNEIQLLEHRGLGKLFEELFPCDSSLDVRQQAKKNYNKIINIIHTIASLRDSKEKGSIFAEWVLSQPSCIDEVFLEHLQHLIFMLAHEPAHEWPIMWDEFNFVRGKLEEFSVNKEILSQLEPISKYIIDLQKQSR